MSALRGFIRVGLRAQAFRSALGAAQSGRFMCDQSDRFNEVHKMDISEDAMVKMHFTFYKGALLFDLRKHFLTEDGEIKPTRKGFAMQEKEWKAVVANAKAIDSSFAELKTRMESDDAEVIRMPEMKLNETESRPVIVRCSLYEGKIYVDIRRFEVQEEDGKLLPTKKGITLSHQDWLNLQAKFKDIESVAAGNQN